MFIYSIRNTIPGSYHGLNFIQGMNTSLDILEVINYPKLMIGIILITNSAYMLLTNKCIKNLHQISIYSPKSIVIFAPNVRALMINYN